MVKADSGLLRTISTVAATSTTSMIGCRMLEERVSCEYEVVGTRLEIVPQIGPEGVWIALKSRSGRFSGT